MLNHFEIVQSNIDNDIKELQSFKNAYMQRAALSKDAGWDRTTAVYMDAALELERCIQSISTIPFVLRNEM